MGLSKPIQLRLSPPFSGDSGMQDPQGSGIEPVPSAMEARSPNHWTTREVPELIFKTNFLIKNKVTVVQDTADIFEWRSETFGSGLQDIQCQENKGFQLYQKSTLISIIF